MSRKTLALWATIMFVVFTLTVIVYPLIFNPQNIDRALPAPQGRELPLPDGPAGPGGPPSVPPVR